MYESKDDLWFYVGFFVMGFYVYDFVDNDIYDVLRCKLGKSVMVNFVIFEVVNFKDFCLKLVLRSKKLCELGSLIMKRS